jgi:hypothetical protein
MKIRCLIRQDGELFVAMSLDFGLAAQGNSSYEAKNKLIMQIEEYIREACEEDSAQRDALLSRKGPISWFISFYLAELHLMGKRILAFTEVKPICMKQA